MIQYPTCIADNDRKVEKGSIDKYGFAGGILMDPSNAFDIINHQLLIA